MQATLRLRLAGSGAGSGEYNLPFSSAVVVCEGGFKSVSSVRKGCFNNLS